LLSPSVEALISSQPSRFPTVEAVLVVEILVEHRKRRIRKKGKEVDGGIDD